MKNSEYPMKLINKAVNRMDDAVRLLHDSNTYDGLNIARLKKAVAVANTARSMGNNKPLFNACASNIRLNDIEAADNDINALLGDYVPKCMVANIMHRTLNYLVHGYKSMAVTCAYDARDYGTSYGEALSNFNPFIAHVKKNDTNAVAGDCKDIHKELSLELF